MSSEIEICNLALSMVGEGPIMNLLNPSTTNEQLCQLWYPITRDTVTESFNWSYAMTRVKLEGSILPEPAFGFGNSFVVPSDNLRVIWVGEQQNEKQYAEFDWRIEGGLLLMDASVAYMRYIRRVVSTDSFKPLVVQAIAARLAMELAIPITESKTLKQSLTASYGLKLKEAVSNDGMQGRSERIRSKKLLIAR